MTVWTKKLKEPANVNTAAVVGPGSPIKDNTKPMMTVSKIDVVLSSVVPKDNVLPMEDMIKRLYKTVL